MPNILFFILQISEEKKNVDIDDLISFQGLIQEAIPKMQLNLMKKYEMNITHNIATELVRKFLKVGSGSNEVYLNTYGY